MTDVDLLRRCTRTDASVDDLAALLMQEYESYEAEIGTSETDSVIARLLALLGIADRLCSAVAAQSGPTPA